MSVFQAKAPACTWETPPGDCLKTRRNLALLEFVPSARVTSWMVSPDAFAQIKEKQHGDSWSSCTNSPQERLRWERVDCGGWCPYRVGPIEAQSSPRESDEFWFKPYFSCSPSLCGQRKLFHFWTSALSSVNLSFVICEKQVIKVPIMVTI